MISGGVKTNVVPDKCTAFIDRRIIPGETSDGAVDEIRQIAERVIAPIPGMRVEVSVLSGVKATLSDPESPLVKAMAAANEDLGVGSSADGLQHGNRRPALRRRRYTNCHLWSWRFLAHVPNEWVGVDEVMEATKAYALTAFNLLGSRHSFGMLPDNHLPDEAVSDVG